LPDVASELNQTPGTIIWVQNGDGMSGNLTFRVFGFSGYNATDNINPVITLNVPANNSVLTTSTTSINITYNGTGTEPDTTTL